MAERSCQPDQCAAGITRRQFVATLTAGGTNLVMASCALHGTRSATEPRRIDVHHHILPPAYLAAARERIIAQGQGFLPERVLQWTPAAAVAELDETATGTAIVSISTPGVTFGDAQSSRRLARECNEYAARLVADYPGRFGFFAVLPLPDVDGALHELEYSLDILKADGVGVLTSYGDAWPGDDRFTPVLDELHQRKAVAYVHPTGPNCCRNLIPYVPYVFTELPHDTTRAITSLLFAGSFMRFRGIRFIFSHAGGTLPMVVGRIERQSLAMPTLAAQVPQGVEYELRRLYYEIAGSANAPAMAALLSLVPPSQVLFGSDFPWGRARTTVEGLAELRLPASERRRIEYGNAQTLFPRLRVSAA